MGHHKRGRAKNRRAGCALCKPHKENCHKDTEQYKTVAEKRADQKAKDEE